ncbi:hypothetical protein RFI_13180 [Reticulomyxa filosa]|uniref:Uncharacterized protein n=1 Tax=Reticulomyxa filosa TaxID=46433 RepID=X6NCF0_RETFI|nr:hypothetical protein RFI_13180 [Reticulomyxa filosa]|eukprot:ETO23980.1 hypothetical protein RFI_13180 [Reticulomyxa filosa]
MEKTRNEIRKHNLEKFDYRCKIQEYNQLQQISSELREKHAQLTLKYFSLECEYERVLQDYADLQEQFHPSDDLRPSVEDEKLIETIKEEEDGHENDEESYVGSGGGGDVNDDVDTEKKEMEDDSQRRRSPSRHHQHQQQHPLGYDQPERSNDDKDDDNSEFETDVITIQSFLMNKSNVYDAKSTSHITKHTLHGNNADNNSSKKPTRSHSFRNVSNASKEEILDEVARLKEQIRDMTEANLLC